MIITNVRTWNYKEELDYLLFFAQKILELAFDKSDFKEKNLHVSIIDVIDETIEIINFQKNTKDNTSSTDLELLLNELTDRINIDDVVKDILGDKREYYLSNLTKCCDVNTLMNTLEVLNLKLNPIEYYDRSKKLISALVNSRKNKVKLHQATTRLFEFLVWYGYQKGTIYFLANRYFFDKSGMNTINEIEDIHGFFELFDLEKKEFDVIFVASRLFEEIKGSCERLGLSVVNTREPLYEPALENKFFNNPANKKVFIECKNIMAMDYLHAMKVAETQISLVSDLFVVFHHKNKPWHSDYCLVYKHDKSHVVKLNKPANIMASKSADDFSYAKDIFPIFLENFSLEKDSFNRFNRGVELHALSLETNEVASQILNFWICLEALLITSRGKTHIAAVVESIELIVSRYALRERIDNLTSYICLWNKDFRNLITLQIPVELESLNNEAFIAALVCVEDLKEIAGELLSKMEHQPLLKFKFMQLVNTMQSQKEIKNVLTKENIRCQRDIRRVYRSRNKIVHTGNISDHNGYVAEMAHYYLDLVLFSIIERKIRFNDIESIDNLINELKISKRCHDRYLKECGTEKLTLENFRNAIFGSMN